MDVKESFYKWKITIDVMLIIGKYFTSSLDYINVMKVSKRYHDLTEMYHYNPISDISLFPRMETQHFYSIEDSLNVKSDMIQYIYWFEVDFTTHEKIENKSLYRNLVLLKSKIECCMKEEGVYYVPDCVDIIDERCFENNKSIEYVNIPSSVKMLRNDAFSSSSVQTVILSSGLTSIGSKCFYECTKLKSIKLPSTVVSIGNYSFYSSQIKSIKYQME